MSCYCSLPGACGVWCVVCVVFVWWGILCLFPPRSAGGWGRRGWWGGMTRWGGIVMEGRWCRWLPLLSLLSSPSACWCPPRGSLGGLVEWRGAVRCSVPRLEVGSGTFVLFYLSSYCSTSLHIVPPLFCLACGGVFVGGEVRWGVLCCVLLSLSSLHLVVFAVTSLLVGGVSLWRGCVIVEWRWWFVLAEERVMCVCVHFSSSSCGCSG